MVDNPRDFRPDPSELTTQALWREVSALKELVFSRLDAIQLAIDIAHQDLVRVPTEVQKAVGNLKDLHEEKFRSVEAQLINQGALRDEKFAGVQKQLTERDVRIEQTARDTKTAIDAALAAQEKAGSKQTETFSESIGKSEASFTKQIDQIGVRITDLTKNFDEKIDGLKQRLDRGEGRGEGYSGLWGWIVGAIAIAIALYAALKP